jgi:hypothetical protein
VEFDAGLFLQVADDAEEVVGLRIPARANMRMRLFGWVPVASPSFSKRTVALM